MWSCCPCFTLGCLICTLGNRVRSTYLFFRHLDCFGARVVVWGTADFGSAARWPTAALNLAAAAGPSLKSSGPRCGLPSGEDDLGAITSVYPSSPMIGNYFGFLRDVEGPINSVTPQSLSVRLSFTDKWCWPGHLLWLWNAKKNSDSKLSSVQRRCHRQRRQNRRFGGKERSG